MLNISDLVLLIFAIFLIGVVVVPVVALAVIYFVVKRDIKSGSKIVNDFMKGFNKQLGDTKAPTTKKASTNKKASSNENNFEDAEFREVK